MAKTVTPNQPPHGSVAPETKMLWAMLAIAFVPVVGIVSVLV